MEAEGFFQSRQHIWNRLQSKPGPCPKDCQTCQEGEKAEEQMLRRKLEEVDVITSSPYLCSCFTKAPARLRKLVGAGPVFRWVLRSGRPQTPPQLTLCVNK